MGVLEFSAETNMLGNTWLLCKMVCKCKRVKVKSWIIKNRKNACGVERPLRVTLEMANDLIREDRTDYPQDKFDVAEMIEIFTLREYQNLS